MPRSPAKSRDPQPGSRAPFTVRFTAKIWRYPGKGGWHFVTVPASLAPPVTHGWGRTAVTATVDGQAWPTSVWRGKDGRTLLPVPKAVRRGKGDGDAVRVQLSFSAL